MGLLKFWGPWPWRIHPSAVRPLSFITSFLIPTAIYIPKSSYRVRAEAIHQKVNRPIAHCKIILHPQEASAADMGVFCRWNNGRAAESSLPTAAAALSILITLLTQHPACCQGPLTAWYQLFEWNTSFFEGKSLFQNILGLPTNAFLPYTSLRHPCTTMGLYLPICGVWLSQGRHRG